MYRFKIFQLEFLDRLFIGNFLKLNDDKSEVILFGSKRQQHTFSLKSFNVGSHEIDFKTCVKNIGAQFDSELSMKQQINSVVKSGWYHLRRIWRIRDFLSCDQTKILVHAFVISRLDANNCLLYGLSDQSLKPLQRLQNAAAKLIFKARKFDHVTPLLQSLHWLPVKERILFKMLLVTYKCVNGIGAVYLKDLLSPYVPSRTLRSGSDSHLLCQHRSKTKFGDRSFECAAPMEWNKLPFFIRASATTVVFKKNLKTWFFNRLYYS